MAEHCPYLAGNMDAALAEQQEARQRRKPVIRVDRPHASRRTAWNLATQAEQIRHIFGPAALPPRARIFTSPRTSK